MTEDTPVIQLGTYTFDKFNVLDPNMYSSSAENISAFSNGMAAVDDLNKKTNHLLQRIQNAEAGDVIAINIDLSNLRHIVNPSIKIMGDPITSASLFISPGPSPTDFKSMVMYNFINSTGEVTGGPAVGLATFITSPGRAGLFVNSLRVEFDYKRELEPTEVKTVELIMTGLLNLTSIGLQGFLTASVSTVPDNFFNYGLNVNNFAVLIRITELILN
jgi:hypothetical protein